MSAHPGSCARCWWCVHAVSRFLSLRLSFEVVGIGQWSQLWRCCRAKYAANDLACCARILVLMWDTLPHDSFIHCTYYAVIHTWCHLHNHWTSQESWIHPGTMGAGWSMSFDACEVGENFLTTTETHHKRSKPVQACNMPCRNEGTGSLKIKYKM